MYRNTIFLSDTIRRLRSDEQTYTSTPPDILYSTTAAMPKSDATATNPS
jgi:hypothetical protein